MWLEYDTWIKTEKCILFNLMSNNVFVKEYHNQWGINSGQN